MSCISLPQSESEPVGACQQRTPAPPIPPTPTHTHTSTHPRLNCPGSRRPGGSRVERLVAMRTASSDPEKEGAPPPQIWTSCPDSNDFHLKLQRYKTLSGALEPFLPERRCQNHLLVHRRGTSNITAAVIETHIEIWRLHSLIACRILFLLRLHFLDPSGGFFLSLSFFLPFTFLEALMDFADFGLFGEMER